MTKRVIAYQSPDPHEIDARWLAIVYELGRVINLAVGPSEPIARARLEGVPILPQTADDLV